MIDRARMDEIRQRAYANVERARDRVVGMMGKAALPAAQVGAYRALLQNPQALGRKRAELGEQRWSEYAQAMEAMERGLGVKEDATP